MSYLQHFTDLVSAVNKKAVTDTFDEVRGLVYSRINAFAKRVRADRDLLVSAGFLGFMQAYDTYDPAVGSFSTWVVYLVDRKLKDVIRDLVRKRPKTSDPEALDASNHSRRVWMRRLWLQDLSEDARTAALAVIEPPIDVEVILAGLGPPTPGNLRQAVREFLKEKGWPERRIRAAFFEVQQALNSEV